MIPNINSKLTDEQLFGMKGEEYIAYGKQNNVYSYLPISARKVIIASFAFEDDRIISASQQQVDEYNRTAFQYADKYVLSSQDNREIRILSRNFKNTSFKENT